MNTPLSLIAVCASVIVLAACDKTPTDPPMPKADIAAPTRSAAATTPAADPSLPPAASVLPATNEAAAASAALQTDGTRNPAQPAPPPPVGGPIPGQNNDHSAPLGPGKAASAP